METPCTIQRNSCSQSCDGQYLLVSPASEARLGDAQVQFPENAHKDVDSENDATRSLGTLGES